MAALIHSYADSNCHNCLRKNVSLTKSIRQNLSILKVTRKSSNIVLRVVSLANADIKPTESHSDSRKRQQSRHVPSPPLKSDISPVRALAVVRLMRVEEGGAFADVLAGEGEASWKDEMLYLERTLGFRTKRLDARDFRQVTFLVGGTVRWKKYLDYILMRFFLGSQRDFERSEPLLLQILRIGAFEILKTENAPYATINEAVQLAKTAIRPGAGSLVNAVLRKVLEAKNSDTLPVPAVGPDERSRSRFMATMESHPVWFVRRCVQRYGEEAALELLRCNNRRPTFSLRANVLKNVTRADLCALLEGMGVEYELSPHLEDFVRISTGMQDVLQAGLLDDGSCSVQDESAGIVVSLLDPQPGESIVDCCSAPGGKTLFAATKMGGTGTILALDQNNGRLRMVREAAERQGLLHVIHTQTVALQTFSETATIEADRVLLDAPCSGMGVLSKRADLRWRRSLEVLESLTKLQDQLLDAATKLVKVGGLLVYSTCSIEPDENECRVADFLERHPEFSVESARGLVPETMVTSEGYFASLPHRDGIDGAFGARLRRRI